MITTEPAGANCEYGGTKIEYAGSTEYVCNGLVGADGKGIVVGSATSGECPEGGSRSRRRTLYQAADLQRGTGR